MFVSTQHVPHPLAEVFGWHERPGAVHRLTPPWQPVRVEQEAASLREGEAVLRFPGGRRWVARHDPGRYEPRQRFVDVLVTRPFVAPLRWEHTHEFAEDGTGTTVTDRVDTPVPDRFLRGMFGYRHRQLVGDLRAHAWARGLGAGPLTVAVTGSSGLVGGALVPFLTGGGHRVVRLVRRAPAGPDERRWDPRSPAPDLLAGVDAVVHLAGAGISGRFTDSHRRAVRESRVEPTRLLARAAAAAGVPVLVSASAVGIYGADRGAEVLTEDSAPGDGFLAEVVRDWEAATAPAAEAGVRTVLVRTGIVQDPRGGALRVQLPLFRAGLGGPLGGGDQWLPWIGVDDLVDVYHRALVDASMSGPVNAVAPRPVTGREYARTLGRALHRPAVIPTPALGPRLLLGGQGAREVALASQRAVPAVLTALGHPFRHPDLEPALRHLLGHTGATSDPTGAVNWER